ncbi:MAG: tripartite tricarboxylate transporter substrate-binding protein [Desulfobacterales bacterium]|nr:tripartite tricarboxylate transporter substrate-binding protein [Desulfobacterales bacterium]
MKRFSFGLIAFILVFGYFYVPQQIPVAHGQDAAAFYKGKTVSLVVPYNPGGGYDTWARMLAPYLAKKLGARVIVRNEPGAGGKVALNRLQKESDGLSLIILATKAALTTQIFDEPGRKFDLRQFNWLGRVSQDEYPVVVSEKSGYRSIADLQRAKEVKFASDTPTSGKAIRPLVMGRILGINVKLVSGYSGSAAEILALQRGEVEGLSTTALTLKPYIESKTLFPVVIMDRNRIKYLPDVPTIYEAKKLSDREKRIADIALAFDAVGRPVATTPNVPGERVAFLESALKKTLDEPDLRKKVEKSGEEVTFAPGKEIADNLNTLLDFSSEDKALFGKLLSIQGY